MKKFFRTKKPVKALPFRVYFAITILLALTGLFTSIYLSISHYRVYTDFGYKSFCAISKAINCDTVSQSSYSLFLDVPVPVWGIIGYTFVLMMLLCAKPKESSNQRMWALIFWIALVFSVYSVILALISNYLIRSYCIMCILTYAVNLSLLWYAWLIHKRFSNAGILEDTKYDIINLKENPSKIYLLVLPFLIIVSASAFFFPRYWEFDPPPLPVDIHSGVTHEGHPWVGAENPVLTISEFTDYQCFQCRKLHFFLRQLVADNSKKVKLIHRHFPMDHEVNSLVKQPFHVGSGAMALLAIYATGEGSFWRMNDLLFENARDRSELGIRNLAADTGLDFKKLKGALHDPNIRHKLNQDIWAGLKLGISGTPAFVIDGKVYLGQIPAEIIQKALK